MLKPSFLLSSPVTEVRDDEPISVVISRPVSIANCNSASDSAFSHQYFLRPQNDLNLLSWLTPDNIQSPILTEDKTLVFNMFFIGDVISDSEAACHDSALLKA